MDSKEISNVFRKIRKAVKYWKIPTVIRMAKTRDPFQVLISCVLSLRNRDEVTETASKSLLALASNPEEMLMLTAKTIEKTIFPSTFYRVKSETILQISRELIEKYEGQVPNTIEGLLKIKGIGRKTANLTMILGYGKLGICVDTHVHRITNRWGYIKTRKPDETEMELRKKLPKRYWREINNLLVAFGQNCCRPLSPHCGSCCLKLSCQRIGVIQTR